MGNCPTCRRGFADGVEVCPDHGISLMPEQAFLSADTTLAAGQKVGDYVVDEVIAEGGFGTVYRVIHPLIGKNAAIKVLKREFSSNPEMGSRFIAEARAVNQIRHKNIIDLFAFGVLA
jgi:serine/threonine-protein kinase